MLVIESCEYETVGQTDKLRKRDAERGRERERERERERGG